MALDSAAVKPEQRVLNNYRGWRKQMKSVQEIGAFGVLPAGAALGLAVGVAMEKAGITRRSLRVHPTKVSRDSISPRPPGYHESYPFVEL